MANKIIPAFTPALTSLTVADADTIPIYDASATSPRTRHITIAELRTTMAAAGGADTTAPTATYSPLDDATGVAVGANLVITFSETVVAGTGNITIVETGVGNFEVIPVGDARVVIAGAVVTINPTGTLAADTAYHVLVDATAFDDAAANSFAGISAANIWNFTTAAGVVTGDRYYGVATADTLDSAGVMALAGSDSLTTGTITFTATPTGEQYIYIVIPAVHAPIAAITHDGFGATGDYEGPVDLTVDGVASKVYRSTVAVDIAIDVVVTF